MRVTEIWMGIVPAAFAVMMSLAAVGMCQLTKRLNFDTEKPMAQVKIFKARTACWVTGEAIDKNRYVDYNGKRNYLSRVDGKALDGKDPEKYNRKIEGGINALIPIAAEVSTKLKTPLMLHAGKDMNIR
jgi:hypothetical protein